MKDSSGFLLLRKSKWCMYKKLSRMTKLNILPPSALYLLLSVSISRGSAISIRSRISPTLRYGEPPARPLNTHLDQVEVDLPVVSGPWGDESVAVLVFLGRVHWSDLLPRHSRLEVNTCYCNEMFSIQSFLSTYRGEWFSVLTGGGSGWGSC